MSDYASDMIEANHGDDRTGVVMKTVFSVKDMNCGHCARRIETALAETPGIQSCSVDLPAKTVTVESDLPAGAIASAISEAGYTPLTV